MRHRLPRKEFLAELDRRGYRRSSSWHESWIELGLLDRGDPTGRAGGGVTYTWPANQIELATALLGQAAKGVSRGALPKIVVFVWLQFGDAYVPYRQIPRAMLTWALAEAEAPVSRVRRTASELANNIVHKQGSRTRALVRALVEFPSTTGDPESLRDAFDDVFDPDRGGQRRGPDRAAMTTDSYLAMLGWRQHAVASLQRYSQDQYNAARTFYRQSRAEYAQMQPEYAKHPDLGRLHPTVDLNELADSACQDLLSCLAVMFESRRVSTR